MTERELEEIAETKRHDMTVCDLVKEVRVLREALKETAECSAEARHIAERALGRKDP